MSQLLIQNYYNELSRLKKVTGAKRESVVREAFKDLLKAWGKSAGLTFITEHEFISTAKVRNYLDGALLQDLRVPFGYWEAKDEDDDLDKEIAKKLKREYPRIPFYRNFKQWRDWGQRLLDLLLKYETVKPFALKRFDAPDAKAHAAKLVPSPKLKSDPDKGLLVLDTETTFRVFRA